MSDPTPTPTPAKEPSGLTGGIRLLVGLLLFVLIGKACAYDPNHRPLPPTRQEFVARCIADAIAHRPDLNQYQAERRCEDAWRAAER